MPITNLVIEGGGYKSFACLGSIKVLEELGMYDNIKNFAGTSSGSIICFLLVCGFTSDEIKAFVFNNNWTRILRDNFIKQTYNLFTGYGINSGVAFMKKIEDFIKSRGISKNVTFKELYEMTGKVLVITGTNLNKSSTSYFSYTYYPDMEVFLAIRISIAIPYFLTAVKYKGEYYVDGGILMNFPLYYFDLPEAYSLCSSNTQLPHCIDFGTCATQRGLNNTLGIWVLEKNKKQDSINFYNGHINVKDIKSYSTSIMSAIFINSEKLYIKKNFWERTISIELQFDFSLTDFNPPEDVKKQLYMEGYKYGCEYFSV